MKLRYQVWYTTHNGLSVCVAETVSYYDAVVAISEMYLPRYETPEQYTIVDTETGA